MSETPKARRAGMNESGDRLLAALFAAEELEKRGFELNALGPDQIAELTDTFGLPLEERRKLLDAISTRMRRRP